MKKSEKGFILIEAILSTVLISILTLSLTILLMSTININNKLVKKSKLLDESMFAINFIKEQIMYCQKIKLNTNKTQLTITYGTETSYLKFDSKKKL